jgi:probable HAF family extracellular repeat protein
MFGRFRPARAAVPRNRHFSLGASAAPRGRSTARLLRHGAGVLALILAAVSADHAQTGAWQVTDIGTLGGLYGEATDINEAGQVVGGSTTAGGSSHAFLWTPSNGMIDLGTLGGSTSAPFGINNLGQVVGFSTTMDGPGGASLPFLWTAAGGMIALGTLGGTSGGAEDINDLGEVVGSSSLANGDIHAYRWTSSGGMVDLGTLGGRNSKALAVNEAGQIVGRSDVNSVDEHAFLWTAAGGMVDLGTLGGASSSASDINEAGQVVGRSDTASGEEHAFLWTAAGGMVDLGLLRGTGRSQADAINDAGEVVGRASPDGDDRGFHWTAATGMVELPTLTGIESAAMGINNAGVVVGFGDIATGDAHAVVWANAVVPPAPVGFAVESVVGNVVTLRWTVPSAGLAPTDFVLEGGLTPGQVLASVPTGGTAPTFTFTAPSGSFYLRLYAVNGTTRSAASNEIRVHVNVPVAPSAPANLLGLANGSSLALAWTTTYSGGAPTSLVLDVTGSATASIPLGLSDGFSFAGVPPGTYTFTLRAQNAAGSSPASNPVTLTFPAPCSGPPQVPAAFRAYRVANTLFVDWAPPAGGPAPTTYVLTVTGSFVGAFPISGRAVSAAVGPGSYTFAIAAANICGDSAATAPITVVVP